MRQNDFGCHLYTLGVSLFTCLACAMFCEVAPEGLTHEIWVWVGQQVYFGQGLSCITCIKQIKANGTSKVWKTKASCHPHRDYVRHCSSYQNLVSMEVKECLSQLWKLMCRTFRCDMTLDEKLLPQWAALLNHEPCQSNTLLKVTRGWALGSSHGWD